MSPCDQFINRSVTQADRADASQRVLQRYSRRRFCRVRAFCSKMSTEFWFLRGVGPPMECRGAAGGVPHFKQLSRLPVLCGSSCAGESYARSFFSASHCIFTCTHVFSFSFIFSLGCMYAGAYLVVAFGFFQLRLLPSSLKHYQLGVQRS